MGNAIAVDSSFETRGLSLFGIPSLVLSAAIFASGAITAAILGLSWIYLLPRFIFAAFAVTLITLMIAIFIHLVGLAYKLHPEPLPELLKTWWRRELLVRMAFPVVVSPMFMTGFVTMKASATAVIPYDWDLALTDLDFAIFGTDPWRLTHEIANHWIWPEILEFFYVGWQLILPMSMAAAMIWMNAVDAGKYYFAMFLTWVLAGVFLAALMHSAGPVFIYVFDAELGQRFAPFAKSLAAALPENSRIVYVHRLLAEGVGELKVTAGGGISAMPSVHLAVTAIYVCAFWKFPLLRMIALLFAAIIWFGSVYFGYHYFTDGPVAFAVAGFCWWISGLLFNRLNIWNRSTEPTLS